MRNESTKRFLPNQFLLSVVLHVLFFISVSVLVIMPKEDKKSREYSINSYVYRPPITSSVQHQKIAKASASKSQPQKKLTMPNIQEEKVSLHTLPPMQKNISPLSRTENQSVMEMSLATLKQNHIKTAMKQLTEEEPILLIGDNSSYTDPFIKLIGRSLSAHFTYPELEGRMGIKGSVLVELVIHPEGYYSDIRIVRPSDSQNFNNAALYAINKAEQVIGVDRFLTKPKRLVIGFIFD